jgi:uncharacterized protein (TIGR02646 family)
MKYIIKQPEPQEFTQWKNQANDDWQPSYDDLSGSVKSAVKQALMQEQGYLCCYCEASLTEDSHIEHLRPQSDPAADPLDFSNMLCSCQNNLKKGEPLHCGNLKGDWYVEALFVSPLDPTCEDRFKFTGDGQIDPVLQNDKAAMTAIEKLGLNIPKIRDLRRNAIEPFLDPNLSSDEFLAFVQGYLQIDAFGKFNPFWTTIKYLFGPGPP